MAGEKNNAPGRPGPGERAGKAAAAEPETAAPAASGSAAQAAAFEDLDAALGAGEGESADTAKMDLVLDIPIRLSVELGRTDIPIRDVLHLGRGSMVELDRGPGAPLDVRVNGVLIGRGEVVVVNEEKLGLRFVDVVSPAERVRRLR